MMARIQAAKFSSAGWIFFALVMLAYSSVVLLNRNPPAFVDFPDWVYQGALFHGVLAGHPVAGYALKGYPVPNSATTVALGLLDTVLPWQWAAKLWIVLYLGLATFSTWMLARALNLSSERLIASLPAVAFLNLDFWYGHISFEIGLCLVMMLAALLIRRASQAAIALLLVVIFFTHMEACAAALLLLALWSFFNKEWRRLGCAVPAVLLTAWYAAARFTGGNVDARGLPASVYAYGSRAFLIYKANTFAKPFGYVNARALDGLSQTERIFGRDIFLLLLMLSLCMAALALFSIVRACIRQVAAPRKTLAAFALVVMAGSVLLPHAILGTSDPGSRFFLVAIVFGLFLVDWRNRATLPVTVLSIVFCLSNLWQLRIINRDPTMAGHIRDLPAVATAYAHVEPGTRVDYYTALQQHRTNMDIFPTALFFRTTP